ncbi:MAG: undecaprenyl-diphosphatase UppP [Deltaproteobacteria bacterium CG11_big_fil_rev_8_21_14_0_20_47_16]|nr:MAG: undecaprenyl-diphosphatase UppP [Deltaproteobacteria bacterium CG11_big_fil_rev_8_21_14_0_20_47_16]
MTLIHAIILGVVQGLGEFLPISSSAHLIVTPWLLKFNDPGLAFDVALHAGTLLAIIAYFWKDWVILIGAFFTSLKKKRAQYTQEEKMIWYLIIASVPGAIIGKLLEEQAETIFRSPLLIASTMAVMGLVLWAADQMQKHRIDMDHIGLKESIIIGFSQALAIVPGVSRSGSTISAGLFLGLTREAAARFSFLMAMPIMIGATMVKAKPFIQAGVGTAEIVGILVSAVVGFLSIKYMLAYVRKYSYRIFVAYRLLFAFIVVVVYLIRN